MIVGDRVKGEGTEAWTEEKSSLGSAPPSHFQLISAPGQAAASVPLRNPPCITQASSSSRSSVQAAARKAESHSH